MLHRRHYVFRCLSVSSSVCLSRLSVLCWIYRKNTARISIKFTGGNHYHEQFTVNDYIFLHFWPNWNKHKGAGYNRKFESTLINFAAMSNRCWRLANKFTQMTFSFVRLFIAPFACQAMATPERKTFIVQRRRHRMTAHGFRSLVIPELLTLINCCVCN